MTKISSLNVKISTESSKRHRYMISVSSYELIKIHYFFLWYILQKYFFLLSPRSTILGKYTAEFAFHICAISWFTLLGPFTSDPILSETTISKQCMDPENSLSQFVNHACRLMSLYPVDETDVQYFGWSKFVHCMCNYLHV